MNKAISSAPSARVSNATPSFRVANTARVITDQGLTYNQAGVTFSDTRYLFGGGSGQSDQVLLHAKTLDIHP